MTRAAIFALLVAACGGSAAEPEPARAETTADATNGSEATPAPPPSTATTVLPLSAIPACDAYLRHYERCEPTLSPSIASGDHRDFAHERAWITYLEGTPEAAGLPDACAQMAHELQAVCP